MFYTLSTLFYGQFLFLFNNVIQHTQTSHIHYKGPWPWPWFIPYPNGHIGPHSDAIRVCQELPPLLPPRWTPSFVGHCCPRPSSSLLVDLALSCILVPASTVLAVVCTCGPYGRHVQASEVVFLSVCCPWFVVQDQKWTKKRKRWSLSVRPSVT